MSVSSFVVSLILVCSLSLLCLLWIELIRDVATFKESLASMFHPAMPGDGGPPSRVYSSVVFVFD